MILGDIDAIEGPLDGQFQSFAFCSSNRTRALVDSTSKERHRHSASSKYRILGPLSLGDPDLGINCRRGYLTHHTRALFNAVSHDSITDRSMYTNHAK